MDNIEFEVGKQYRNRRGGYTVLELRGPKMFVQYADGQTGELTMEQQAQIYFNILVEDKVRQAQEEAAARHQPKNPRATPKASPAPTASSPRPVATQRPATSKTSAASEPNLPRRTLLANSPNDQTFRAGDIRILSQFKGYGNPNAPIWFMGFEDYSDLGTVELKHRLALDIYEEPYVSLPERLKLEKVPLEYRYATPAWKIMAYMGSRLNGVGQTPTPSELDEYYASSFGTKEGNLLISDLLPLPTPGNNDWPYSKIIISDNSMVQYELRDRKIYTAKFLPERINIFNGLYEQRKARQDAPRYIFCYGRRYWSQYRKVFPFTYSEMLLASGKDGSESNIMLARDNKTGSWVVLLGTLSDTRGDATQYLCDQLAQRLELLNK